MWWAQVDQNMPQRIKQIQPPSNGNSRAAATWTIDILQSESFKILYIFTQNNAEIKYLYCVQLSIGSLPPFHLGTLCAKTPAMQTEPNFLIQPGTKCTLTITEMPRALDTILTWWCKTESKDMYYPCAQCSSNGIRTRDSVFELTIVNPWVKCCWSVRVLKYMPPL